MLTAFLCMKQAVPAARNIVVVPAYTCYSILAAIDNAGLRAAFCDVMPRTLDLNLDQLRGMDMSQVLCIVTGNLYGIPNSLTEIEAIARSQGVFMFDDAAQSLGARFDGRPAGGFGDVGLYSFDKGKNIPTIQGGALVVRDGPLAGPLQRAWKALPATSVSESTMLGLKLAAYALLLRPTLYDLVRRMPGVGLGQTPYETEYPCERYSRSLAGIALRLFGRLQSINEVRVRNAGLLDAELASSALVTPIEISPRASPVFLRLPTRVRSAASRAELVTALVRAGIGATESYPRALADLPAAESLVVAGLSRSEGARVVASTIITLPTHAYCDRRAIAKVGEILRSMSLDPT